MKNIRTLFAAPQSCSPKEARLLRFSPNKPDPFADYIKRRQAEIREHGEKVPDYRKTAEENAAKAEEIAEAEVKDPYAGRAFAPEIDFAEIEQQKQIAIEDFDKAEFDKELSANTRDMIVEAKKLEDKFKARTNSKGRQMKGLVFGIDYQSAKPGMPEKVGVKVITGDPEFIASAINFVASKQATYDEKQRISLTQQAGESDESFEARQQLEEERAASLKRFNSVNRARQMNKWGILLEALRNYDSEYAMHEEIRKDIIDDSNPPERIRWYEQNKPELFEQFKRERPMAYLQALRDAAKRDPSILEGRENELVGTKDGVEADQMYLYLQVLEEAAADQPAVAANYPDRLKRIPRWEFVENDVAEYFPSMPKTPKPVGLPVYRNLALKAVEQNADFYIRHILPEREQYWTQDVPAGNGMPQQSGEDMFKKVTVAAIKQNPSDVFFNSEWRSAMNLEQDSLFSAFVENLDFESRLDILKAIRSPSDLAMLDDYNGGVLQLIDDLIGEITEAPPYNDDPDDPFLEENPVTDQQKKVVRAVLKNPVLQPLINREVDSALHEKFRTIVMQAGDQDMLALLGEEFALDETSSKVLLNNFVAELKSDPEGAIRKYRDKLGDIPRHVLETPKYKQVVLDLVEKKGELFAELPAEWCGDKEIIMKAVRSNAAAFSHILGEGTQSYKNDLAVIFMALEADAEGKGELDWSQVGPDAIKVLKEAGIAGVPQAEQIKEMVVADPEKYLSIAIDILDSDALGEYLMEEKVTYVMIRQYEDQLLQKGIKEFSIKLLLKTKQPEPKKTPKQKEAEEAKKDPETLTDHIDGTALQKQIAEVTDLKNVEVEVSDDSVRITRQAPNGEKGGVVFPAKREGGTWKFASVQMIWGIHKEPVDVKGLLTMENIIKYFKNNAYKNALRSTEELADEF